MDKLGEGKEGCVLREGQRAFKIVFPKDDAHNAKIQREIELSERIHALDPEMTRFVAPRDVYRTNLQRLRDTNRALYDSFLRHCLDDLEDRSKLPEYVYIGSMPILRPIEGRLNPFQKNYVKESIRMLHSAGLSHNDIHLGNIMIRTIGENEYPVIIDFGLIGLRDDGSNDFEKFDEFFVNRPPEIPSRRKRDRDAS